jgi:hypothetical protein
LRPDAMRTVFLALEEVAMDRAMRVEQRRKV